MRETIRLNCDLGESFGRWKMGNDAMVMPHIQQANVACGFHAGDPCTIKKTLALAKLHRVDAGAHPSYPDLAGFGRRSMQLGEEELINALHYQVAALEGMAKSQGIALSHIKPHGALYNDMMTNNEVFLAVFKAVASYHTKLPLVIQATPDWREHQLTANKYDIDLLFEAFVDRRYTAGGRLVSRSKPDALLGIEQSLIQARGLIEANQVEADNGEVLTLKVDTLCIHGDGDNAVELASRINRLIGNLAE